MYILLSVSGKGRGGYGGIKETLLADLTTATLKFSCFTKGQMTFIYITGHTKHKHSTHKFSSQKLENGVYILIFYLMRSIGLSVLLEIIVTLIKIKV